MSLYASNRLPYDESATPRQMAADCRAVGIHLRIAEPRAARPGTARTATNWQVSDSTARFADGLHLHLN